MRRLLTFLTGLALVTVLLPTDPAGASTGHVQSWLRSERGGMGTSFCGDLGSYAQRRANEMAASRRIWHGSDLGSANQNWEAMGEIVGSGGSAEAITNAWRGSSSHRSTYMSARFIEAGVGVAQGSDGNLYSSVVFRDPTHPCGTAPAAAPPAPAAPRAPAPPRPRAPVSRRAAAPPRAVPLPPPPPPPPPELASQVKTALRVTKAISQLNHAPPAPEPSSWSRFA